ncbi:VanZ family protein [Paenibacillus aurantiacus]|uniref:VanZ family protein n=1 Tax=Paenibacillus aurantiacus TaxID=1936118 RepID=A0ABV5KS66_9BACL
MRMLAIVLWCGVLFVGTCTVSVSLLMSDFYVHFDFTSHAHLTDLFKLDIMPESNLYVIQKIGHITGFFILSLLLTKGGKQPSGLIWAVLYALLTELLQPFFNRDGRLIDVLIDSIGIFGAYVLCRALRSRRAAQRR